VTAYAQGTAPPSNQLPSFPLAPSTQSLPA
jgi:hypothetical protein